MNMKKENRDSEKSAGNDKTSTGQYQPTGTTADSDRFEGIRSEFHMTQSEADRQSHRKADVRYEKRCRRELRPGVVRDFVGVDGEGGNDDRRHYYYLLRAGQHVLETGKPLDVWECLEFLTRLPKGPIYVSYFFDYDTTQILRSLPVEILGRILDRPISKSSRGTVYVGNDYWVGYLPRKELRVRRG